MRNLKTTGNSLKDGYTLTEFYQMLKLGIFKSGKIINTGYLTYDSINERFLRKPLSQYASQLYAQKQLSIGLYLLDAFLLAKNNDHLTYLLVFCVCRTGLTNKEKIYVLRLSEVALGTNVLALIGGETVKRKRKSVFRKKTRRSFFDASPLNSIPLKQK